MVPGCETAGGVGEHQVRTFNPGAREVGGGVRVFTFMIAIDWPCLLLLVRHRVTPWTLR